MLLSMSGSLNELVGNMTVADLANVVGLDVREVVAMVMGSKRPNASTKRAAPRKAKRAATRAAPKPNPRGNRDERAAAYTAKVRDAIVNAKSPVSSAEIRAKAGGNTSRCGLALKRLLTAGVIKHDGGRTSARRYSAA